MLPSDLPGSVLWSAGNVSLLFNDFQRSPTKAEASAAGLASIGQSLSAKFSSTLVCASLKLFAVCSFPRSPQLRSQFI